ncbi:MAG: CoA transferase [Dehalococcoidia bacterium]|nr:CoA transferase [Dehalococcoidia bacterium]
MTRPLDDIRVIDLSSGPAPAIATMILGDFGADVIKVEPPGGDPARSMPSAPMLMRGKRSVVLDLPQAAEQARLHELVRGADVVVASFAPGTAQELGADYDTLRGVNPSLVYCSHTGWGERGPLAHYPVNDHLVAAKSGRMRTFAGVHPRPGPGFAYVQVGVHGSAQAAAQGIIAALMAREVTGEGQFVETSLLRGHLPYDMGALIREQLAARDPAGFGADPLADAARMPTLNYHPVMTKDGRWIQLGNLLEHLFYSYVTAAELFEFLTDERFQGQPASWSESLREYARDQMLLRMQERTAEEWMQAFRENGNVAAEPYLTTQEGIRQPDLLVNGDVVETVHPRLGKMLQLGPVARLTETPGVVASSEPLVGEHTAEVFAESPRPAPRLRMPHHPVPRHPLEGVTVMELSTIIATPLAATFLGDLGARVIKVEPTGGDPYRVMGAGPGAGIGASKTNVAKESILVDLKAPDGQAIVQSLLAQTDVVMHNYRPGVPERLGIGFQDALRLNPRIVYVSANGYGPDGPGATRPCAHPIPGAALGGAFMQSGLGHPLQRAEGLAQIREEARRLMRANEVNPDPNASMTAATAAMLGLYASRRLGVGQEVFVDMMGASAYANSDDALWYEGKPDRPVLDGALYGLGALYRLYPAQGDTWVFLVAQGDEEWSALCRALGRDGLASDERFATREARTANDAALIEELSAVFASDHADAWEARLIAAGVGCVRADEDTVGTFFLNDPQAQANEMAPEVDHMYWGRYRRHGPIVTFDRMPGAYRGGSIGGDSTDSLLAELGYDASAIADLRGRRIVAGPLGS